MFGLFFLDHTMPNSMVPLWVLHVNTNIKKLDINWECDATQGLNTDILGK